MEVEQRTGDSAKRFHRILVQVTDDEIADGQLGSVMSTMLRPGKPGSKTNTACYAQSPRVRSRHANADVDVLNCKTLALTKKNLVHPDMRTNQIMYFDCVGRRDRDPLVRNELNSLFDMLLVERQNCCLVNVKPIRKGPTNFFNSVLVPEVDKRLHLLQGTMTLQTIKMEYFDVQKYDVVNMVETAKPRKTTFKELSFRNTRELLRWTQRMYPALWAYGSEHDCFEMEFDFMETPNEMYGITNGGNKVTLKLSIMQFYLSKMDGDMRVGLRNFFENISQPQSRVKQSILTDYLREYFFCERDLWHIWMLFEVPSVNYGSSLANDMLTLASAAYAGVHDGNTASNNDSDSLFSVNQTNGRLANFPRQVAGQAGPSIPPKPNARNMPGTSTNATTNKPLPSQAKTGNYSLSFWYCRIDESYVNVISAMERYYDRKYDMKMQKMCGDLKRITRNIDKNVSQTTVNESYEDDDINGNESVQSCFLQYKEALNAFRILVQKVERTKYAEQLKVFVKTKNNDIAKQTRQMKVRLLELCQTRLSNTIKDEVSTLTSDKDLTTRKSESLTKTLKIQ